jgi:transcriptional regulator with XRE-family HTH domain
MPETAGGIAPLNWPQLVAEAMRRRKAEKLTQKEHAALASVSVPTIIAFDRGERTLSLGKAMDILRVVGLIEREAEGGTREAFVQAAMTRWRELIKGLPENSFGRFPTGWYRIDYAFEGDLKDIAPGKLMDLLRQAEAPHGSSPLFQLPRRQDLAAYEIDGMIECWLAPRDVAYGDFWRVTPSGRAVIIRGYQEDAQETFAPGMIFDTTLPVWRIGEAFLHAVRLARLIASNPAQAVIRLRVLYTGLQGRDLRAWASLLRDDYFGGGRSRSDEIVLEGTVPVVTVETDLAHCVLPLVASLFERFGVTGLSADFVETELIRMRRSNFKE